MKKNLIYKIFLILFAVLYVSTAFISFLHAIEFFSIGNVKWMSFVLSGVFEIGQMTVLMSLLLSDNNKKFLPWVLMTIFTSVQVISNVYSVTKFIMLSEVEYYKYLAQALKFIVQNIPQDMIMTVIAWIIGGLLPVCALLLTAMCASQMRIMESNKDNLSIVDEELDNNPMKYVEPDKEKIEPIKPIKGVYTDKEAYPKPTPTPKEEPVLKNNTSTPTDDRKTEETKKAGSRMVPAKDVEQNKAPVKGPEKPSTYKASDTYFEKPDVERK